LSIQKPKLIVIDGNSLLYRAFFAMKPLSASDGTPTNALYGLALMLLKVLDEKPDYIAVAFDTPAPTFRHLEFQDYKAQRKPPPDALIAQMPIARELFRAFKIPVIEVDGYEADDLIGAIAQRAKSEGISTTIVTGDLDALQLVSDDVSVLATIKGVSDTVLYDPQGVRARFGLAPEQMADYKALKGDPSDNIPGVPGIGDKTALELLSQYGSVENLLDHLDDLPEGRTKRALEQHAHLARLSKRLATIVKGAPIGVDIESLRAQTPDYDAIRDLFVRLEFKTIIRRLPEVATAEGKFPGERPILGACRRISSQAELEELIVRIKASGECALQCHSADGKSIQAEIIGFSFSVGPGETAYVKIKDPTKSNGTFSFDGDYEADLTLLAEVLSSPEIAKYCHDAKLSYAALGLRGVELRGVAFDTMLAAYLLDSTRGSFALGDVAFEQLSLELPGVTSKQNADVDFPSVICGEAEAIYRLKPVMEDRLAAAGVLNLLTEVELPLAPILAEMELTGVCLDVHQLDILSTTLEAEIRVVEERIFQQCGKSFNIGSPKQLQAVLFEKMGIATSRKTKTGYSTSASVLEELAADYPVVEDVLRWRELTKIKSTYADALPKLINPKTGRVHTSLNQAVTATGRLSSSDPNLQNIPVRTQLGREIRKAFIAAAGQALVSADYSQIELRILAHVTGDPGLLSAFENDQDIHTATACTLFDCLPSDVTPEMRRRAKTVNFAVIYGMSDFSLGRALGVPTREARDFIDNYFAKFPAIRDYTEATIAAAREQGFVTTLLGRRRYVPDVHSANYNTRQFAERAAVNMPIQGTAADIMKLAMIRVSSSLAKIPGPAKMLLQVHDELLVEVPINAVEEVAQTLREGMSSAYKLRVPLRVDVKAGPNWAEMLPVSIT